MLYTKLNSILLILLFYIQPVLSQSGMEDSVKTFLTPSDSITIIDSLQIAPRIKGSAPIIPEILIGAAAGAITSIGTGFLSVVIIRPQGEMGGLIALPFAYLGFVIGSATGVHLVAKGYNPNSSWANTALAGLTGTAFGFGIYSINHQPDLLWAVLIAPVVFEVLYVNWMDNDNVVIESKQMEPTVKMNPNRFSDYYNNSMQLKFELIKIRL